MADKIKKTTSKNPKTVISSKSKKPGTKTRMEEMKSTKALKKVVGGKKPGAASCGACSAG